MLHSWLLALGLTLCAVSAGAQQVSRIDVIEYGIYTAEITSTEKMPNGIERNNLRNICHVATTTKIPARMGVMFGFRFQVEGTPEGAGAMLMRITRYPTAVQPIASRPPVTYYAHEIVVGIGAVSYIGYGFDYEWELIPGRWVLELWQGRNQLAAQEFMVEPSDGPPLPRSNNNNDSNCFRYSSL